MTTKNNLLGIPRCAVLAFLLALAPGMGWGQTTEPAATPPPLPPAAQEALRKATLAVGQQQWAVALRYFGEMREAAPGTPQPLFNLGLAESKIPGRELRSIAWFRAYLALAPDAPNATAVRDQIDALDITAEGRANEIFALLKQYAAQLPAGKSQAQTDLDTLAATLAAPTPALAAVPDDVPFSAAQRAEAWGAFVRRDLAAPLFVNFQTTLDGTAAVDDDTANKSGAVFAAARGLAHAWLARLADVRRAGPEADFVNAVLAERAQKVAAAAAAVRAAERLARFAEELKDVTAFVTKLAADSGPTMVPIAPGEFTMGSPSGETGRSSDEGTHRVTISRPFFLGATELTQAQWTAVMGSNPSSFKGENLPVESVSWEDAMAFCKKLTAREREAGRLPAGWEFTLPTEAQWEYACRAGTTGDYAGEIDAMAWYDKNSESKTHAVGTKQANAWGLSDMHGNVWEWCLDWYGSYASGSASDPAGAASGSLRVFRGGGWGYTGVYCRSAYRCYNSPGVRYSVLGFRPALSSVQ